MAVRVYAPGSIGNIGPGLDILGMALEGAGDIVEAERAAGSEITILDAGHRDLPQDPAQNTAALAARAAQRLAGGTPTGLTLRITKGLALSGGQGGSAASAVAGAVAVDRLFGFGLSTRQLALAALEAETHVAGRHLDNILPSLVGGVVLVRDMESCDFIRLPGPARLAVALVHPAQRLRTADGRAVLPAQVPRELALYQAAQVAAMTLAFMTGDLPLLGRAVDDRIAEPARAPLLPGFREAKAAALAAGALGCSISGSGPTTFAFAESPESAARVAEAMRQGYASAGVASTSRVTRVSELGARVVLADR